MVVLESVLSLIFFLDLALANVSSNAVVATFTNPDSREEHKKLIVHKETGNVYVGALNQVYQFNENLALEEIQAIASLLFINSNKVLVLDYSTNNLIACGSRRGHCSVLRGDGITKLIWQIGDNDVIGGSSGNIVAFIGPGQSGSVLYMGANLKAFGGLFALSLVPSENFKILWKHEFIQKYEYVYGFSLRGYSYFLVNNATFAKIVRVKQDDNNVESAHLSCEFTFGIKFNTIQAAYLGQPDNDFALAMGIKIGREALFVVFSNNKTGNESESILCVYPLSKLPSNLSTVQNIHSYSHILFQSTQITSVAALALGKNTIAFLGTSDGHLKRLTHFNQRVLRNEGKTIITAIVYDDQVIDSGKYILPDMSFDVPNAHLYVLTDRKVFKVSVRKNCSVHDTCDDCINKDALCEWCVLQNRCVALESCKKDEKRSSSFQQTISFGTEDCSNIQVTASNLIKLPKDKDITMLNVSLSKESVTTIVDLVCRFHFPNEIVLDTSAKVKVTGNSSFALCPTPPTSDIPQVSTKHHYINTTISVQSLQINLGIRNLTIYDCGSYSSCTSCRTSQFKCNWSVLNHRCEDRNDKETKGIEECPRILGVKNTRQLLIPFGTVTKIEVNAVRHEDLHDNGQTADTFLCRFEIEGRVTYTNSIVVGDTLYCDSLSFTYNSQVPSIHVGFDIVSRVFENITLDNPTNFQIIVYHCGYMSDNCELCQQIEENFACGWCDGSSQCTMKKDCDPGLEWADDRKSCSSSANMETVQLLLIVLILVITVLGAVFALVIYFFWERLRRSERMNTRMDMIELRDLNRSIHIRAGLGVWERPWEQISNVGGISPSHPPTPTPSFSLI